MFIAGCSTDGTSSNKVDKKAHSIYYQNMTKSQKRKVEFKFKLSQDETKDNTADPVYMVSMKVTNNSNNTVKFHKDKFVYALPEDKVLSSESGPLTVKAGQTRNIDQLFDNVPEQGTLGDGVIEYLNGSNKLAYAKFVNDIATSDNLKDKTLSQNNKDTTGDTDDEDSSSDTYNYSESSTAASSSSSSTSLTESQAAQILQDWGSGGDFGGYSFDELVPTQGNNGSWSFQSPDGLLWTVNNNGTIHAPGDLN